MPARSLLAGAASALTCALALPAHAHFAPILGADDAPIEPFGDYFANAVLYGTPDEVGDSFGNAVAVSGARIAVGAPGAACPPPASGACGAVSVFARVGSAWVQQAGLYAGTPQASAAFGLAVALDGDWLLAGAPFEDRLAGADAGNAYLFHFADGAWAPVELNAPDEAGAQLGRSVAISRSGVAAAGQPGQSRSSPPMLSHNGAVATFSRDTSGAWSYEGVTRAETPASNERFGSAIALHTYILPPGFLNGFALAVGAPGAALLGHANAGKGYVFTRAADASEWTQRAAYGLGPQAGADDNFGAAVAIDAGTIAFGVPHHQSDSHDHAGSAYVVRRNGSDWASYTLTAVPPAADPQDTMQYGYAVGLKGDDLFIGAPGTDFFTVPPQNDAGGVYWYRRASTGHWEYEHRLRAATVAAASLFGAAVAYDGVTPVFGAPRQPDGNDASTGAVHVFAGDEIFADGFD